MNTDDVVIINDNDDSIDKDSDVELVDISKEEEPQQKSRTVSESSNDDDAVVVVEDNTPNENDDNTNISNENDNNTNRSNENDDNNTIPPNDNDVIEVIEIDRDTNDKFIQDYLSKVCHEDRIVGEFIEKCLCVENSTGMLRVIHRTFLPLYFKMDDHRDSKDFKKVLEKTMRGLEVTPNRKFSHLKTVCELMKRYQTDRKKVKLTTCTNVTAKPCPKRKRRKSHNSEVKDSVHKKAKRKPDVLIILDDVDDASTINKNTINEEAVTNTNSSSETENIANEDTINKDAISHCKSSLETEQIVILEDDDEPNNSNKENHNQIQDPNLESNASEQFLVPQKSEEYIANEKKLFRIQNLEKSIETFKKLVDELEQQEVNTDSSCSPYVQCEHFKGLIVKLYKELCTLTGSEAVKRREVRLKATEDRPQLPVKILEDFINDNIGSDGNPSFPDYKDVVKCVSKANVDAKLGWTTQRIMAEARNLFTYCGQALQANRKKREWRYLLRRMDSKINEDPAETDPVLMERLEANRRIAVKKEFDLLEKYVQMEQNHSNHIQPFRLDQAGSDDEDLYNNQFLPRNNIEITNNNTHIIVNGHFNDGQFGIARSIQACGSHTSISNTTTHDVNGSDKYTLQSETNTEINNSASSLENYSDKTMLEICVENNTAHVEVINVISKNTSEILPPKPNDSIRTNVDVVSATTDSDFTSNDKQDENSFTGDLVIKDVYSIANVKQEFDTTENGVTSEITKEVTENNNISNEVSSSPSCEKAGVEETTIKTEHDEVLASDLNFDTTENGVTSEITKEVLENTNISNQEKSTCENAGVKETTVKSEHDEVLASDQNFDTTENGVTSDITKEVLENTNISNQEKSTCENAGVKETTVKSEHDEVLASDQNFDTTENGVTSDITKEVLENTNISNQEKSTCENAGVKETTIKTEHDETLASDLNSKVDAKDENLIQAVKIESSAVLKDMQKFGDSFTTTIFDIEDPFLVIEISESSDDSDCEIEPNPSSQI